MTAGPGLEALRYSGHESTCGWARTEPRERASVCGAVGDDLMTDHSSQGCPLICQTLKLTVLFLISNNSK